DGTDFAGDGPTRRGRRSPSCARPVPEAPRQPGSGLRLKGMRSRPWGDRRRPDVDEGELDHATRVRPHDRAVRPGRERLSLPTAFPSRRSRSTSLRTSDKTHTPAAITVTPAPIQPRTTGLWVRAATR